MANEEQEPSVLALVESLRIKPIERNKELLKELWSAANRGDTYIHEENLKAPMDNPNDHRIVVDGGRVYLAHLWDAEVQCGDLVTTLLTHPQVGVWMPERPTSGPLVPTDQQWKAVERAFKYRMTSICGLPGTGKTTLIKLLLDAIDNHPDYCDRWQKYALAAPTGKAARRLSEATGREAQTIHRLLGYNPNCGFMHNEHFQLMADFIIIDESSMVDIQLAAALLKAIPMTSHIIFIGDAEQLPPVKAGRFFEEILKCDKIPQTRLTEVFRQAAKSLIVQNAHRIINGKEIFVDAESAHSHLGVEVQPDFHFVEAKAYQIPRFVADMVKDKLPAKFGVDPINDVLTISPMKPGGAGLEKLNEELKLALNPGGEPIGIANLHVGDRVIQTQNDYDIDIMNGEMATIEAFDHKDDNVLLDLKDRKNWIPAEKLTTFLPGYAISIHRSQGSQAPVVIVVLDKGHRKMLNRRLINTAITRAQMMCIVVGQWDAINFAIGNENDAPANCGLLSRICS